MVRKNVTLTLLGATRRHYIPGSDVQSLVQRPVKTVAIPVPGLVERNVVDAPTLSQ